MHPDAVSPRPAASNDRSIVQKACRGKIKQTVYRQVRPERPARFMKFLTLIAAVFCCISLYGCLSAVTDRFADNLSYAILNNNDLALVKDGGPAYLIMIDAFLRDNEESESLLRAGAELYSAYTNAYVASDEQRAGRMTDKALNYAFEAVCIRNDAACRLRKLDFGAFEEVIKQMEEDDVPALYTLGTTWAGWIQAHRKDWSAVAEIARVESIMKRMLELDETYKDGGPHLYMGVLMTLLPPAMGGKPEKGRMHFERAIDISGSKNLMAKVIYARQYARLMFDRELHDQLLNGVMAADPNIEGYTLSNTLAQKEAKALLESADDYF